MVEALSDSVFMSVTAKELIHASRERVYAALTRAPSTWWGAPYLERDDTEGLVLEHRIGGRFYAHVGNSDKEGNLFGIVIALKEPELIRMQGPFGMGRIGGQGTVQFALAVVDDGTEVEITHFAIGNFDDETRERYQNGWKTLLGNLKGLVEARKTKGLYHDPALDIHHHDD